MLIVIPRVEPYVPPAHLATIQMGKYVVEIRSFQFKGKTIYRFI